MNKYLSKLIHSILSNNEKSRDDWMLMIKEVHDREMVIWAFTPDDYYKAFFSGKLSNVQTIIRLWRLLQEKCPELRGETWEERQRQGGMLAREIAEEKTQLEIFDNEKN